MNKLYDIEKGEILIDDFNIDKINISTLRKNIAVVLQDVFLFAGTIKDNITLENKLITNEKVIEAAKLIGVHDFIMKLPDNYNFNVGERGNSLSMGQKQLISFIRALLYNPSILILDEATSSIDSESEILIQKATEQLIKNRTSIIIAHRLSTIKKANKIIVLDNGEIKEIGSHEELINKNGYYTKLYNLQFNINEKILI